VNLKELGENPDILYVLIFALSKNGSKAKRASETCPSCFDSGRREELKN
jgi:hypothetical protein